MNSIEYPDQLAHFFIKNFRLPSDNLYEHFPKNSSSKEILSKVGLPYLKIELPFKYDLRKIQKEILALDPLFLPYREKEEHQGWSSIALHGISSTHTKGSDNYGYSDESTVPYTWTNASERTPYLKSVLADLWGYKEFYRVRVMKVEPGGFILPHSDGDHHSLGAINWAIVHPEECEFLIEEYGLVPFREGDAFFLDTSNNHSVWNKSKYPRYHLIIHGERDSLWDEIVLNSYQAAITKEVSSRHIFSTAPSPHENSSAREAQSFPLSMGKVMEIEKDMKFFDLVTLRSWTSSSPSAEERLHKNGFAWSHISLLPEASSRLVPKIDSAFLWIGIEPLLIKGQRTIFHDHGQPSQIYHRTHSVPPQSLFSINPFMEWSLVQDQSTIEKNLFLIENLASHYPSDRLLDQLCSQLQLTTNSTYQAINLLRAKNGFALSDQIFKGWTDIELTKQVAFPPEFKLFLVYENTSKKYIEITQSTLMPLQHQVIHIDDIPRIVSTAQHEFLVFIEAGTFIWHVETFMYYVIQQAYACLDNNELGFGHILAREKNDNSIFFKIHSQFSVFRTKIIKEMIGSAKDLHGPCTVKAALSSHNVHDDYTPLYIRVDKNQELTLDPQNLFAQCVVLGLQQGFSFHNVNSNLRGTKTYAYSEGSGAEESLERIKTKVNQKTESKGKQVFLFNVEDFVNPITEKFMPKHLITVASGLNPALILKSYPSIEKVTFLDFSKPALFHWKKLLRVKSLDELRELYSLVTKENLDAQSFSSGMELVNSRLEKFIERHFAGDFNTFKALFSNKTFEFKHLDIIDCYEYIGVLIKKERDTETLIWFSNVFYSTWSLLEHGKTDLQKVFNDLCELIKTSSDTTLALEPNRYAASFWDSTNLKYTILDDGFSPLPMRTKIQH